MLHFGLEAGNGLNSTFVLIRFFGTSENAVKSQIWIAVSVYVIIAIIRKRLQIEESLHTILQTLSLTLFEKTTLKQLLSSATMQILVNLLDKQMNLFDY